MPLFGRGRRGKTFAELVEERAQLVAELEAIDADVAWTAASDDRMELAESSSLRKQADALRRSIAELDRRILEAAE
jgi:transcription elongation GreA/GreB family factor